MFIAKQYKFSLNKNKRGEVMNIEKNWDIHTAKVSGKLEIESGY